MFPGMEDLISLLRVLDYYKQNTYDVIIIDCAPTGETLAMLSFPDMLGWWMEKLFLLKKSFKSRSSRSPTTPWCPSSNRRYYGRINKYT